MDTSIVIIRHAEKPSKDGLSKGVNPSGDEDDDSLSVRGWQRSGALASLVMRGGLRALPDSLVAANPASAEASKRAVQTLTPLSDLLAQAIDQRFAVGDEVALSEALVIRSGLTLVAWKHKAIHLIGNAIMGNTTSVPQDWPGDRFDLLWRFDLSGRVWTFKAGGESLLSGDSQT